MEEASKAYGDIQAEPFLKDKFISVHSDVL